jgi:hypothetical protein
MIQPPMPQGCCRSSLDCLLDSPAVTGPLHKHTMHQMASTLCRTTADHRKKPENPKPKPA